MTTRELSSTTADRMKGDRAGFNYNTVEIPFAWSLADESFLRHSRCKVPEDEIVFDVGSNFRQYTPITREQQNLVLHWIQSSLGIVIQQYRSSNSASDCRKSSGHDENLRTNNTHHPPHVISQHGKKGTNASIGIQMSTPTYLHGLFAPSRAATNTITLTFQEQFWDPWYSGTLLSEVVASLLIDNRHLVKEVDFFDQFGRRVSPPKLLLVGTVHVVKSTAQILNNVQLCLKVLSDNVPSLTPLNHFAQDIVHGPPDRMWRLLFDIYRVCGSVGKKVPPSSSSRHASPAPTSNSVAASSTMQVRGRQVAHTRHGEASTVRSRSTPAPARSSSPALRSFGGARDTLDSRNVRFSSSTKGTSSPLRGSRATTAVTHNDLSKTLALPTRSRSGSPIERNQRRGHPKAAEEEAVRTSTDSRVLSMTTVADVRAKEKQRDRDAARVRDRRRRQRAIDAPIECIPSPVAHSVNQHTQTAESSCKKAANGLPGKIKRRSSDTGAGGVGWCPPPLSSSELELVRKQNVAAITATQQSRVKTWLASLQLYLLDGEGGYVSQKEQASSTAELPPPLPLPEDRLRNGVLLCGLALLLERNASGHVGLATSIHSHPTTLQQCMENLERSLWLFRLRRSPPIPLLYLVQPEEMVRCNKNLLWGLLFEIMQAYPVDCVESLNANEAKAPKFDLRVETDNSSCEDSLEDPHSLRRVKLSAVRRREVDVALMTWLTSHGVVKSLYGNEFSAPVSVMALEAFVKDSSLFRAVINDILGIRLAIHKRPSTFDLCMGNMKRCVETLRRLGGRMNGRYLFVGVEEALLRGDWDTILGLLNDIKTYAENISRTEPVAAFHSRQTLELDFENQFAELFRHNHVRLDAPSHQTATENALLSSLREEGVSNSAVAAVGTAVKVSLLPEILPALPPLDTAYLWGGPNADLLPFSTAPAPFASSRAASDPPTASEASVSSAHPFLAQLDPPPPPPPAGLTLIPRPITPPVPPPAAAVVSSPSSVDLDEDSLEHVTTDPNRPVLLWLKKQGIEVDESTDFSDGVVLHTLVTKLERCEPLSGFKASPKSSAQRFQNIRRSLEFLATNQKRIPLAALSCEEAIHSSDYQAVMELLREIKRVYSNHIP